VGLLFGAIRAARLAEKVAREHSEQIERGLQKAAKLADERTGGKHSERIGQVEAKAGALVTKLGSRGSAKSEPAEKPAGPPPAS